MSSSNVSSTATYQIDDNAPVVFELSGAPSLEKAGTPGLSYWRNQLLFNISNLDIAEHTAVVTFNGTSTGPLVISYFYVSSLTASQQKSQPPHPSHTIEEAALGAVIPILLLIVMAVLWYQRKIIMGHKHKRELTLSAVSPFIHYDSESSTTPSAFQDLIVTRLGQKALVLSTTPVINPGEVDLSFDAFRTHVYHMCRLKP